MKCTVYTKNVYGNELVYPIGEVAHCFARLTGKKTFSRDDLHTIELLGYEIEQVVGSKIIKGVNKALQEATI